MSYVSTGVTDEQEQILLNVAPEKLEELSTQERLTLALEKRRVEAAEKAAFWDSVASVITVVLPLATALGLTAFFMGRKGNKK